MEELCELLPNPEEIKESLFPEDKPAQLSLEEAAQVISIKLSAIGKNIHEEIAELIGKVDLDDEIEEIEEFFSNRSFRIITTNYDKLSEKLTGENSCQSIRAPCRLIGVSCINNGDSRDFNGRPVFGSRSSVNDYDAKRVLYWIFLACLQGMEKALANSCCIQSGIDKKAYRRQYQLARCSSTCKQH